MAAAFSTLITVFVLGLFAAGVMKLFQIHTTLLEIKDALRRPAVSPAAPGPLVATQPGFAPAQSGEDMLRALDAQMQWEEAAARRPEVEEPR